MPAGIGKSASLSEVETKVSDLCLVPGCEKPRRWKGICQSCYGQAKRLIDSGKTTWEELQEMGLAELEGTPLLQAFNAIKKAQQKKESDDEKDDATRRVVE